MPDKTLKILFTARAVFQTSPEWITYEAGSIHTMREDLALRWVKRGVATDDPAAIIAAERAAAPPPPTRPKPPPSKPAEADEA